jgi:H+/gluconate symporter-like permease
MTNCAVMAAPGMPQINNVIMVGAMKGQGIDILPTVGLIPGWIGALIATVCGFLVLTNMIIKAQSKGEGFVALPNSKFSLDPDRKVPHFIVAIIPLIIVFVFYTLLHLSIVYALGAGIILALVLMGKYIQKKPEANPANVEAPRSRFQGGKNAITSLNEGGLAFPTALLQVISPAAFAAVISSTAAFGMLVEGFFGMHVNPLLFAVIAACIIVALTSSPPAALMIVIPITLAVIGQSGVDVNPGAIARVTAMATTTFETLPFNGVIVVALGMSGITAKEGYKPMFYMSVLFTLIGTIITMLILMAAPQLA